MLIEPERKMFLKKVLETDLIYQLGEELDEEEEAIVIESEATKTIVIT
jgi:hypothetical protein